MQKSNKVHVLEADDTSSTVYKLPVGGDQNRTTHRKK